jgi:hypothetical protein
MSLFQTAQHKKSKKASTFPAVLKGDSATRFAKARSRFKKRVKTAVRQAVKSERLSQQDFAIRINAR